MEDNLQQLLKEEKEYRSKKNYHECFTTCLKILDEIQNQNENIKFETISQIFLYTNQSNYVKINLMDSLIKNFSFINNKESKKKYYKLLINSFDKGKDKDYLIEVSQIKKLYQKSELNNFFELDKYISNLVDDIQNKSSTVNNSINYMNSSMNAETSLANLNFKETFLNLGEPKQKNEINNIFESISERTNDLISTSQESLSGDTNFNDRRKASEMKNLLKKYRPDPKAPMVIISISANVNSNQFLNLINENFEKFSYHNICTIKNSDRDNIRVYEYQSKNCLHNLFSKICKNKNGINILQVLSILKPDENNFDSGIKSLLNDTYERKISIKTIKGSPQNSVNIIIKFLRNFCIHAEKIKVIKQSKCFLRYNLESDLKKVISVHKSRIFKGYPTSIKNESEEKKRKEKNIVNDITLVEKKNDSASRYYEMYKIFSKKEYGLGKTISEFIDNFKKEYKLDKNNNLEENKMIKIDTKSVMMKIINIFENSINTLNSTFNFDEENKKSNSTTFFANASEQFILNKIYPELYNIYNIKYKKENEIYLTKKKEINEKLTLDEIGKKIGIKQKLRGNDKEPFKRVIDIINKIELEKILKKKYEIMTQASLEIRNCVLDNTNCKYELDSMDDELPIVIYITTQLNVNNLFAELYMIEDYIKCSLRDRLAQNKTVTNLLSSLLFISNSWDKE